MNKQILKDCGFSKELERIEENKCSFCDEKINPKDFRDSHSLKEFTISGLCQNCQDKIFS